jgi:hypothetical protein
MKNVVAYQLKIQIQTPRKEEKGEFNKRRSKENLNRGNR